MRIVFSSLEPAFSHQVSVSVCYPFTADRRFAVHHQILLRARRELHSHAQLLARLVYLREKGNLEPGGRGPHPGVFLRSTIAQRAPSGSGVRGLRRWARQHVSRDGVHLCAVVQGPDRCCSFQPGA